MSPRTIGIFAASFALAACGSDRPVATETTAADAAPAGTTAAAPAVPAGPVNPAPEGLPSRIATQVITASGQTCAGVAEANRAQDGTITASCTGGERYRVFTADTGPVAQPL